MKVYIGAGEAVQAAAHTQCNLTAPTDSLELCTTSSS